MISKTKLALLVFALLLTLLAFSFTTGPTRIVIDRHTSAVELAEIQEQMQDKGYVLRITKILRTEDQKIRGISGEVDFGNGNHGTFSTDHLIGKILITHHDAPGSISIQVNRPF